MRFFLSTNSFSRTIDFYFLIIIPNSVSSVLDLLLEPLELPVFIINVIHYITYIIIIFHLYNTYKSFNSNDSFMACYIEFFLSNILKKHNLIFNVFFFLSWVFGRGRRLLISLNTSAYITKRFLPFVSELFLASTLASSPSILCITDLEKS